MIKNKHSAAFKNQVVQELIQGDLSASQLGRKYQISDSQIHMWWLRYRYHGAEAFSDYSNPRQRHSVKFKMKVLRTMERKMLSTTEAAALFKLGSSQCVSQWQKAYAEHGIKGLEPKPKAILTNPRKTMPKPPKNKSNKPVSLEKQLKEQQEELEYLRAENAYLKKLDALMLRQQTRKKR